MWILFIIYYLLYNMKETLIYIVGGLLIFTYIACILLAGYTMILVSNVSY